MKLPMTIDYGLRIAIALARNYGRPVSAGTLAKQGRISKKYVEMILGDLRQQGLVVASRGVAGGYILARSPEKILLLDIVEAVGGRVLLFDCLDNPENCFRAGDCEVRGIWAKVRRAIKDILGRQNLSSLAKTRSSPDYVI